MQLTTKLEALNSILQAASEAPVSSLSVNAGLQVSMALALLDEVSREVQSHGWFWNVRKITYSPDANGYINIPGNIIELDSSSLASNYSIRGSRLFNLSDGTDVFTSDVTLCVKELLDWDDIPEVGRKFIMLSAARRYTDRTIGTAELARFTRYDEQIAWANLRRYELSVGDHNLLRGAGSIYLRQNPSDYLRHTW